MKKKLFIFIMATFSLWLTAAGCGTTQDPINEVNQSISEDTIINLKEGGYVGTADSGVYFPPQDSDISLNVTVSGSGESENDPFILNFTNVNEGQKAALGKSNEQNQSSIIFYTLLNQSIPLSAGTYGTIRFIQNNGSIYSCSGIAPDGSTYVEGAIIGPSGTQYIGCIKTDSYDEFSANFYIDSNSINSAVNDLMANIRVVGPLCSDKDCGDLAEPIDMLELYSAYSNTIDPVSYSISNFSNFLNSHISFTQSFLIGDVRRMAYESMLFEIFTQKYLWMDYQEKIEEFLKEDVGLPKFIRDFTKAVKDTSQVTKDGKDFLRLTPDVIRTIRSTFGWSHYATFKNTLNRFGEYLDFISQGATFILDIEEGAFEWFLYQILDSVFTENYILSFESEIFPNIKDPELKTAFLNTKKRLLGTLPDGSDGLLHDNIKQMFQAITNTGIALTIDYLKIHLGRTIEKYISSGFGMGVSAAKGIVSTAATTILAGIVVSAIDDGSRFSLYDAPILIALSTFIYNNYSAFNLFDESCPADDSEETNLLISQNMFYAARMFFSLLKNNYDRWLVSASSLHKDLYQWLAAQMGLESNAIWTTQRSTEVAKNDVKYAAKTIKAMEILFTCELDKSCDCTSGPCCDGCNFRPSTYICQTNTELSCHWGTDCGSDVAQRTQNRYCSGMSASCNGAYDSWSDYTVSIDCAPNQNCSTASSVPTCVLNLACGACVHTCSIGQTRCEGGRIYNCITNSSGCRVWDSGSACPTGLCTSDGLQCDSCSHACSIGDVRCTSGRLYNCTTNSSGCRVWDAGTPCPDGTCADATHCAGCTPHHHNACYDNDVYSYDSCNVREGKVTECGDSGWTGTTLCQSDDVYQDYVTRGCSGSACTSSTSRMKKEECDDRGCSGGVCCTNHATYACYDGDVYWYSGCNRRQDKKEECGTDTAVGSNYCYDEDLYRDYDIAGCSTNRCTTTRERRKQIECGTLGCDEPRNVCCTSHASYRCDGGDVYWFSSCGTREGIKEDCHSTQTCSTDRCVCPSSTPWTSNTLTATVVSGGIRLTWNPAPSSWIHHYEVTRMPGSSTPPPGMWIYKTTDASTTSWTDTTGTPRQCYTYLIYGYDACGANRNTSTLAVACFP